MRHPAFRQFDCAEPENKVFPASGGTILHGGLGVRAYPRRLSAALAAATSFARWLIQGADQQGAEGLERVRVAVALSCAVPI